VSSEYNLLRQFSNFMNIWSKRYNTLFLLSLFCLEFSSIAWNSIMPSDANKLESIQQKFSAFCFNRFFPQFNYSYAYPLEQLKLHTLLNRRYHLDAQFLIQVNLCSKFHPSVLKTAGLRLPALCIREFSLFSVCSCS
jgi:hypothetical protein